MSEVPLYLAFEGGHGVYRIPNHHHPAPVRHTSQFTNNHSTEMCSGSKAGS